MAIRIFDEMLAKGIRQGKIPAREEQAKKWYRDQAASIKRVNENTVFKGDQARMTRRPLVGNMYLFHYDAKWKDTLPYWDRLPLIFPFRKVKGGFYGINMHYLPHQLRAELMDALYDITNNKNYDETTKLNLSYKVLMGAAKFKAFKPCVKHYLTNHTRSRFIYIYPVEWDIALWLPLERFQKARKTTVWKDSKRMLK